MTKNNFQYFVAVRNVHWRGPSAPIRPRQRPVPVVAGAADRWRWASAARPRGRRLTGRGNFFLFLFCFPHESRMLGHRFELMLIIFHQAEEIRRNLIKMAEGLSESNSSLKLKINIFPKPVNRVIDKFNSYVKTAKLNCPARKRILHLDIKWHVEAIWNDIWCGEAYQTGSQL